MTFTLTTETIAEQMRGVVIGNFNAEAVRLAFAGVGQASGLTEAFANGFEDSGARLTMLASEPLLGREWNTPEEDKAWADL
jgi:hypothetical protein